MGRPRQFLLEDGVDEVLEQLVRAARAVGSRVSRSDIVNALIWNSRATDGDAIGVIIRSCRRELISSPQPVAEPVSRRPGPRPYFNASQ